MKATWNNIVIAESDDTALVEANYYFPESALKKEYVTFSNHKTSCAWKGQASYYSLLINGEMLTDDEVLKEGDVIKLVAVISGG